MHICFLNRRAALLLLGCIVSCLLTMSAQAQVTRYVSTTGTTPAISATTSWATSTTDLQEAINASQPGDQVWVAEGIYKPTSTTARDVSFSMKNGVTIYGGFTVGQTDSRQRSINPITGNPSSSTLSGEIGNPNSTTDNSYHVINNPASLSLNNTAVLDGFVITGGNAGDTSPFPEIGGGVYNDGRGSGQVCNPTFRNCVLLSNYAYLGGAMYNDGTNGQSTPVLTNCIFLNNRAATGGAIFSQNSSSTLINCSFQSNQGYSLGGGAIYNQNGNYTLTNCSFLNNQAQTNTVGGGAIYNQNGNCTLTNCSFLNNQAQANTVGGGVIYNQNGSSTFTNCVVWGNGGSNTFKGTVSTAHYSLLDNTTRVTLIGSGNLITSTSPFASSTSVELAPGSTAINAGDINSYTVVSGPPIDLAGNPRLVGSNYAIDMGAYEVQNGSPVSVMIVQQPPSASVVCAGVGVTVSVSATGTSPSYQWYRNGTALTNITSATTANLLLSSVSANDAGSYSVVVTGGLSVTSDAFSLTVNALPSVTVTANPSNMLTCATSSLTLTATSSETALRWSTGETTAGISVSAVGTYFVTATGANGCTAVSNSLPVNQDLSLPFSINSVSVCMGQTGSLLATGCSGQVRWSTGVTGSSLPITAGSSSSVLTATCTVGSCSATASGSVVVGQIQPPAAQIVSLRADESGCPVRLLGQGVGTSFVFTGPQGYVFSNVYRAGGRYNPVGLYMKQSGVYTLVVTYTNECGSSTPVSQSVTVSKSCP